MGPVQGHSLHDQDLGALKLVTLATSITYLDDNIVSASLILQNRVGREVTNFVQTPLDALDSFVLHHFLPLLL